MPAEPDVLGRAFATLGLPVGAGTAEVKKRYRRLARRWHPDRFAREPLRQADATRRMQEINAAYEAIRDVQGTDTAAAAPPRTASPPAAGPPPPRPRQWPPNEWTGEIRPDDVERVAAAIRQMYTPPPAGPLHVLARAFSLLLAVVSYSSAVALVTGAHDMDLLVSAMLLFPLGAVGAAIPLALCWSEARFHRWVGWLVLAFPGLLRVALRLLERS